MEKKFEVGMRVRVYSDARVFIGTVTEVVKVAPTVTEVVKVAPEDGKSPGYYWTRQCVRLAPRKRREWWIGFCNCSPAVVSHIKEEVDACCNCPEVRTVHVREIPAKKGGSK